MEELFFGSSRGTSLYPKVKIFSTMPMGLEMECRLAKKISKIRKRMWSMTKLKLEKIGRQRKSGGIIKVSLF